MKSGTMTPRPGHRRAPIFVMANANIPPGFTPPRAPYDWAHVEWLFERLGLGNVSRIMPHRALWATYVFVNGFLSIALLAVVAILTGVPFIFPSVGPTAYQLFFSPRAEASAPRNTLMGHLIGLVCGYIAFRVTGVPVWEAMVKGGFDIRPVIAASLSLAATAALMILFRASHPPAGATTLIVSLGIITSVQDLAVVEAAVAVITLQAFCVNRLAGLPYPAWQAPRPPIC